MTAVSRNNLICSNPFPDAWPRRSSCFFNVKINNSRCAAGFKRTCLRTNHRDRLRYYAVARTREDDLAPHDSELCLWPLLSRLLETPTIKSWDSHKIATFLLLIVAACMTHGYWRALGPSQTPCVLVEISPSMEWDKHDGVKLAEYVGLLPTADGSGTNYSYLSFRGGVRNIWIFMSKLWKLFGFK